MESSIAPLLKKGDYICGSFVKAAHTSGFINDSNPGDRSDQIGRYPFSLQNTKEAIYFASDAQKTWKESSIQQRMEVVSTYQSQLEARSKILAKTLSREIGIPLWEAKQEVTSAYKLIDELISVANRLFQEDASSNKRRLCPLGTVSAITPFSQPLYIPTLFSCSAILMGNSVVHKPSKYTPGSGQAIADLWDRCKLPRGVYNMVQGPGSHIGQYILSHPKVNATLFAGGYSTATEILTKKPLAPHHQFIGSFGGKSSAIVLNSAQLEHTAREILASAVRYTGQKPSAISRIFITKGLSDILIDTLAESLDQIKVGYATDKSSYLGPMISEHWRNRYHRYGHNLYSNGHTPIRPVENMENDCRGYYVRPALYKINWSNGSKMLDDDPPGPIILIYEVKNFEEALQLHNEILFRQMVSIFGSHAELNELPLSDLSSGAIYINQSPKDVGLPFGNFGMSSNIGNSGSDLLRLLVKNQYLISHDETS